MNNKNNILQCQICGKIFENMMGINCHVRMTHSYKYGMDYFKKYFKEYYDKKQKNKKRKEKLKKVKCIICEKEFCKNNFIHHVQRIHNIQPEEYYNIVYPNKNICNGIIKECGNKKRFIPYNRGYSDYCSECLSNSKHPSQYLYWIRIKGIKTIEEAKILVSEKASQNKKSAILKIKNAGHYDLYTAKTRFKNKNGFLKCVKSYFKKINEVKKYSMSFKKWIKKITPKYVLNAWFDNDIKNLYKEIPNYIKDSFKNNQKIFRNKGKYRCLNMYTEQGEFLNSSYEINFYLLLKKHKIEYKHERKYSNSKMRYDFYLPKYDLYIEIAGMINDEEYKEKMIEKHKNFNAVILKTIKEQEEFIRSLKYGRYKKKTETFDMSLLFS